VSPWTTTTTGFRPARLAVAEDVDRRRRARGTLSGDDARLRRIDVDAAREIVA